MALIVAAERGFVAREKCIKQTLSAVRFLARADRFHGVWPHFLDGRRAAIPLLRQIRQRRRPGGNRLPHARAARGAAVFRRRNRRRSEIRDTITRLWQEVEWDWYRKTPDSEVLYWHWSPDMVAHQSSAHRLERNDDRLLARHRLADPIPCRPPCIKRDGPRKRRGRRNIGRTGVRRPLRARATVTVKCTRGLRCPSGSAAVARSSLRTTRFWVLTRVASATLSPARFATDYFGNNRILSLINHRYCVRNPDGYAGYGDACWA